MEIERAVHIFDQLAKLTLDLPRDPAGLGPDFLREQISLCRNYLNEVSFYHQEILREKTLLSLDLEAKETSFQMHSDELLASDQRVAHLPAVADRQAMVNVILSQSRREILDLQQRLRATGHIEKVIKHRKEELDNTMSAIRLQRSLLKDQLRSLQGYGDETLTSRNDPTNELSGEDLDALLSEAEAEIDVEASKTVQISEPNGSSQPVVEEPATEDSEEEDFGIEVDDETVDLGGAQDVVVEEDKDPNPDLSGLDADMHRFLGEQDFPDLDEILADV